MLHSFVSSWNGSSTRAIVLSRVPWSSGDEMGGRRVFTPSAVFVPVAGACYPYHLPDPLRAARLRIGHHTWNFMLQGAGPTGVVNHCFVFFFVP